MKDKPHNPLQKLLEKTPPVNLSPDATALLVVDMQYFDAHPDWGEGRTAKELGVAHCFAPYFAEVDNVIPRIQQLLTLFRKKSMEVIHIRVSELTEDSRDVGRKQLVRGLVVPPGSKEATFLEELNPASDELVISKSSSGVFPVTNLDRLLRNMGITTLVFTGTSTGGCVESAVRDAADLGYDVVVVSDACVGSSAADHEHALAGMEGGLTHIVTTADLSARLADIPPADRKERSGVERVKRYLPSPPNGELGSATSPYDLIFPPAIELPLVRESTALLLIDVQRFTCDPAHGLGRLSKTSGQAASLANYYRRVETALVEMQTLLEACRAKDLQIIHLRTAGQRPDGRDLSRKLKTQGLRLGRESPEVEIMPEVMPRAGEIVRDKPASGIFTGTGLDELLRNLELDTLIIAGISFDGAVEGSIRSATDRGYGVILIPSACAAS
ncbi:MAG: cysteine hydrolase, partial [Trueperaceae bacterium]